jgi:hypothetical protein
MSTHMVSEEETTLRRRIAAPRRIILGMAHGIGFTMVYHIMGQYGAKIREVSSSESESLMLSRPVTWQWKSSWKCPFTDTVSMVPTVV